MLFNSLAFAVFLPIVFFAYWLFPAKQRWILLLVSSLVFYMSWNAKYVILILFTTVISYAAGICLEKTGDAKKRKLILAGAVVLGLSVLFFFKYFNFVSETVSSVVVFFTSKSPDPVLLNVLLPVGISFYTFQTIGYVIDVYRGDINAERHFGYYATFISFFPQLVAGPIERTENLLPQIKEEHRFDYDKATYGMKLMAWGFFKKIVIADTLSQYVSKVFDDPKRFTGFALVLATAFFAVQIYCDFSGYSDIAIGAAKLFGIDLMTNFKSPCFSQSIREFWSRWHISLSNWFRDYVYIPLGGNRVGKARHAFNLLVTFFLSGLWHGADMSFVVWGGIHGVLQIIENAFVPKEKRRTKSKGAVGVLRVLLVFALTSFAWIFFVSGSIEDAFYVISHAAVGISSPVAYVTGGITALGIGRRILLEQTIFVLLLAAYDFFSMKTDLIAEVGKKKAWVRYLCYCLLLTIILFYRATEPADFVYFQF